MEPEGSLQHSQVPATCPYPEPAQSSPCPTSWRSILILSSPICLGLPSGLVPSGYPAKTLYTPLLYPHTYYMPSLSSSSRFYHPNNIGWGVQIIKLLLFTLLHFPVTSSLLGPNILLNTLVSNTLILRSFLNVSDQISHPSIQQAKL